MASHMKTTVQISDSLLAEVQNLAAREGTTLKALVNEGLLQVVAARRSSDSFKLADASVGGQGLNPAFEGAEWEALRALAYEGRGG